MKSPSKRLKTGTVYVFGAGVSYAATAGAPKHQPFRTAPLDKEFCRRLMSLEQTKLKWVKTASKNLRTNWKDHRPFDSFGLEEAIITQLGYAEFIESIYRRKATKYTDQNFLRDITHLIAFDLGRAKENKSCTYKKLAKYILPNGWNDQITDRVITFNYDTLFDTHLMASGIPDRCLYFDRISDGPQKVNRKASEEFPNPLMLKLHGSINWLIRSKDFDDMINGDMKSPDGKIEVIWKGLPTKCPAPRENTAPCLVPPLPNKPITSVKIFKWLWTKAAEYLAEAEHLVIAGYSLPATDNLAWSLFGTIQNKRLKTITVIDPDPLIWRKWKLLLNRANLGSTPRWAFHSSMEEYFVIPDAAAKTIELVSSS